MIKHTYFNPSKMWDELSFIKHKLGRVGMGRVLHLGPSWHGPIFMWAELEWAELVLGRVVLHPTGPLLFFLFCCPFVPPFSSVCCTTQQPLYCVFTLTTNLRRPLWVNRWFQPYLVLRNEQLESKQSQVKTYPIIQVSNSKLTNL